MSSLRDKLHWVHCKLHIHRWRTEKDDQGSRYRECADCGTLRQISGIPSGAGLFSNQLPDRKVTDDRFAESRINLLVVYFESSRQELVSRLIQRDNALLLFLVATTAIFGVAFGNVTRPGILFAISPLSVGVAILFTQHNDVIGRIAHYCGMELTEELEKIMGGMLPDSWETSQFLSGLKGRTQNGGFWRRTFGGLLKIPKIYSDRLLASIILIAGPGIIGVVIGFFSTPDWPLSARVGLVVVDALMAGWTISLLWHSADERYRLRKEVGRWRDGRIARNEKVNEEADKQYKGAGGVALTSGRPDRSPEGPKQPTRPVN